MSSTETSTTSRSAFVALVGRPNVGKSTLLNRLLGTKISIVSRKPQTTRNRILGVFQRPGLELVLLDTPGIHHSRDLLGSRMVQQAEEAMADVELVVWLIDPQTETDPEHPASLLKRFEGMGKPLILVLNKIDRLEKTALLPIIERYARARDFAAVVPLSAKTGEGVDALISALEGLAPEGPPVFGEDVLTDRSERFLVAELIREKLVRLTGQELPYRSAVVVEAWEEDAGTVRILARIVVERKGQKAIVIGKKGELIKRIGTEARIEIERLLGCPVYLQTHVAVDPKWSQKPRRVDTLGNFE